MRFMPSHDIRRLNLPTKRIDYFMIYPGRKETCTCIPYKINILKSLCLGNVCGRGIPIFCGEPLWIAQKARTRVNRLRLQSTWIQPTTNTTLNQALVLILTSMNLFYTSQISQLLYLTKCWLWRS